MKENKFVGLKGIACLIVFVTHFFCAFLPGIKFGTASLSYFGSRDISFGNMTWNPLKLLWGGDGAVILFIVLSCYFVMNSLMNSDEPSSFIQKANRIIVKRYPRLVLPILASCLLVFVFQKTGLLCNLEFQKLVGYDWLDGYYQSPITLATVLRSALLNTLTVGDGSINTVLWMMDYIFWGTFVSIILSIIMKTLKEQSFFIIVLLGALLFYVDCYYATFSIAAIVVWFERFISVKLKKSHKKIGIGCFVLFYIFTNFSQYVPPADIPWISEHWVKCDLLLLMCSALFLLLGFILCGNIKGIICKVTIFMDKISFALCLVHMPILCSLSCFLMRKGIYAGMNYALLCIIVFIVSMAVVLISAWIFHRYVEKACDFATDKMVSFIMKE